MTPYLYAVPALGIFALFYTWIRAGWVARQDAGDARMTESIFDSLVSAFNEDRDMISAQHHNIQLAPDLPMLPLAMDSALLQFRRALAAQVAREQAA